MASIIDPKYRGKYTKETRDWVGAFIDTECGSPVMKTVKTKDEDGTVKTSEVATGKVAIDVDKLFKLAEQNHIDCEKYAESKDAVGRMRMTLGNSLRAAARKRHGLKNLGGTFMTASTEFVKDLGEATETADGQKIAKAKPEAAAA